MSKPRIRKEPLTIVQGGVTRPPRSAKSNPGQLFEELTTNPGVNPLTNVPTTNSQTDEVTNGNQGSGSSERGMGSLWPDQGVRDGRTPANTGQDPHEEMEGAKGGGL